MKYPIIPIAFFYVNGIFFSDQLLEFISVKWLWINIVILFLFFLSSQLIYKLGKPSELLKKSNAFCVLILFFIVGVVSFQNHKIDNNLKVKAYHYGVLTIDEVLKSNKFQNRYFGDFITSDAINQKILLYQPLEHSKLKAGDRVNVTLFVDEIPSVKNPNQFNYSKYLANKSIFIQAKLPNNYLKLKPAGSFKFQLLDFREKLMKSFDIHHFPIEVKGIVYALLFGQRADLSEKIVSDYRNAGVMHILAISGLHIGILYWIINLTLKFLIRSKNIRFVVVIAILCCFAIISGLSGSVVRAVLMFLIVGSGMMFKRKTDTINVLVLSLFCILVINPNFLFDIGFQLSYLAVFSIVYLYPIIQNKIKSRFVILNYFLELIGISIVAQLGILPLTIYYFGQIPLLFLLGNLIVIPVLTIVLIGLVFLLILNFVWKGLSVFLGRIIEFFIEFTNRAIAIIASQNDFILSDIKMNLIQCMLFLSCIFLIAYAIKKFSFNKLIGIAFLIIALQISYFSEAFKINSTNEMQMLYDYNSVTVAISKNKQMIIYSTDSSIVERKFIAEIEQENEIINKDFFSIQNFFRIDNLNFLIVDSLGIVDISTSIDVLILKDNAKFNLDRYLIDNKPRLVVIHPKNYLTNVERWMESCEQNKIPFHNMREKGFVDFEMLFLKFSN